MKKVLGLIVVILIVAILGYLAYLFILPQFNKENRRINNWISQNNLNKYGDASNTAYSSGAPCANTLECFDYIKKMHPDKPWEK